MKNRVRLEKCAFVLSAARTIDAPHTSSQKTLTIYRSIDLVARWGYTYVHHIYIIYGNNMKGKSSSFGNVFCCLGFVFMLINIGICFYLVAEIGTTTESRDVHPPKPHKLRAPPPPPHRPQSPRLRETHHKTPQRNEKRRSPPPPPPRPQASGDRPRPHARNVPTGSTYQARLEDGSFIERRRPKRGEVGFVTNMLAVTEDWPVPKWKIGEPPIIPGDHIRCLRRLRPEKEVISFMHIAKAGGSAFGADLKKAKLEAPRCSFTSKGLTAPPSRTVEANAKNMFNILDRHFDGAKGTFGGLKNEINIEQQACTSTIPIIRQTNIHFDNSVFTTLSQKLQDKEYGLAPVTVIRDPISRINSHFFYIKDQAWSRDMKCGLKPSVAECLKDPDGVEELQTVFRDGQAAALWFAGMHTGNWIKRLGKKETDDMIRDFVENPEESLRKAVEAFFDYLWVGIRGSEYSESKQMLEFQARFKTIGESHANRGSKKKIPLTPQDKETLRRLVPVDLAFFEYVQAVHKVRYEAYTEMLEDPDAYHAWCDDPENWDFSWEQIPFWYNGERIV